MFLHGGVEFLGKVVANIGHPGFLLIGSAHAALVLTRLFIVLLFGVLAVSFRDLEEFEGQFQHKAPLSICGEQKDKPEVKITGGLLLYSHLCTHWRYCSPPASSPPPPAPAP